MDRRFKSVCLCVMVRLARPVAINSDGGPSEGQTSETAESQEGRIHSEYQQALQLLQSGNKLSAQVSHRQLAESC